MKQLLRFQISGITCIFWIILFFIPYIDWSKIDTVAADTITVVALGAFALALPLGTIIHQISISLLSPFRKIRLFNTRSVSADLKTVEDSIGFKNRDKKNQFILVFSKAIKITYGNGSPRSWEIDVAFIREEISNRYSYYYARVDNGLFAPLIGFGIFHLVSTILRKSDSVFLMNISCLNSMLMPLIAIFVGFLMICYVPALLKEVDDIEKYLLKVTEEYLSTPLKHPTNEPK